MKLAMKSFIVRSITERSCGPISMFRPFSTIADLKEKTRIALESNLDDGTLIHLLNEWSRQPDNEAPHRMDSILSHWLDRTPLPRTTMPFSMVLAKHREAGNGHSAALVLDRWGAILGGDLELSPPLSAFHMVMEAHGTNSKGCNEILKFLEQAHMEGDYALSPTVETYSYAIASIFANEEKLSSDLVERMQEAFDSNQKTPASCYHMLRAYSKAIGTKSGETKRLEWFEKFEKNLQVSNALELSLLVEEPVERVVSLLGKAYGSALKMLVNAPTTLDSAQKGKAILDHLESLKLEDLPWPDHFVLGLKLWTERGLLQNGALEIVQDLLHRFEHGRSEPTAPTRLPFKAYELAILFLCQVDKAARADELLLHFMRLYDNNRIRGSHSHLITRLWNNVIQSHFRENRPDKAVVLWDRMLESDSVTIDQRSYSAILKSISRLPHSQAVRRASSVWETLQNDSNVTPHASHFASLISTWASSPAQGSADYALEILDELEARYKESRLKELKPQRAHYSAVITAFARNRDSKGSEKALAVYERMKELHQPDTAACSALIASLANGRSVESAEKSERILEEMCSSPDADGQKMKANVVTYTSVVVAWAKSGSPEAPERAENILTRLLERYVETGDETLRPDSVLYGAIIKAWATSRRSDMGERAEAVLGKIKDLESESGKYLLNSIIYTNIISAHWRGGRDHYAERSLAILQEMKERAANGDIKCRPDVVTYTTVIQALARSKSPKKSIQAWQLLTEMCNEYRSGNDFVKPNVFAFTACLNACAHTRGTNEDRKKAVEIALMAMNEFQANNYDRPSHIMYATLLKVFGEQVSDTQDRLKYAGIVFNRCCVDGQVDESTVKMLEQYVPGLFKRLPRNRNREIELPPEWTMNVKTYAR